MAVCENYPEQLTQMSALAHARLARDALRKALPKHPIFEGCAPAMLEKMPDFFQPFEFNGGDTIFRAGEPADSWLFVGLGSVLLRDPTAAVTDLAETVSKEFLSVHGVMDGQPRTETCR